MRANFTLFTITSLIALVGCGLSPAIPSSDSSQRAAADEIRAMSHHMNLSEFDTNDNGTLDDDEFFEVIDSWIAGQMSDSLFFTITDAWVATQPMTKSARLTDISIGKARSEMLPERPEVWKITAALEVGGRTAAWTDKEISVMLIDPEAEGSERERALAIWARFNSDGFGKGEFLDQRGNPIELENGWQVVIMLSCGPPGETINATIEDYTVADLRRGIDETPVVNF